MSENNNSGGFPLAGVLGVVFIILKLTDVIDWSWWWVLSPFWIQLAVLLVIFVIAAPFAIREVKRDNQRITEINNRIRKGN